MLLYFMLGMLKSYLVFIEVGNDHTNEKSKAYHATKKHKHMNVYSMYLQREAG